MERCDHRELIKASVDHLASLMLGAFVVLRFVGDGMVVLGRSGAVLMVENHARELLHGANDALGVSKGPTAPETTRAAQGQPGSLLQRLGWLHRVLADGIVTSWSEARVAVQIANVVQAGGGILSEL